MRRPSGLTDALFFATLFCVTFEKVHWQVGGQIDLADVLTIENRLGAVVAAAVFDAAMGAE